MKVSVAICTWNLAALLDQTLAGLQRLRVPAGVEDWELLVVSNNCTDATDAVLARHAPHLPLRPLQEPRQGHSHARNCAVAAAQGDLLLWTDDDVLVDPAWLAEHVAAAERWPEAAFFGGPVEPWYAAEPAGWIKRHLHRLGHSWAVIDNGPDVRPLGDGEKIYGANMAYRTAVQKQFVFDPRFGRKKDELIGSDEVQVLDALRKHGHHGVWVGTARVKHYIPAERLTGRYVWEWQRCQGRAHVREQGRPAGTPLFGAPRWVVRKYCLEQLKSWALAPFQGPRWLRAFLSAAWWRGVLDESRAVPAPAVRS